MLKRILCKLDKSLILFIKMALYFLLAFTFFMIMSIENKPLLILSRTMGITILTFIIVGMLFLNIYGQFDIGKKESKPIIYSQFLAVIFTDIVTYLELMIMNTIAPNIRAFRFTSIEWMMVTMVVQLLLIIIFAYGGNALYYYIHDPEPCCIIASSKSGLYRLLKVVNKYEKQYKIEHILHYNNKNLKEYINDTHAVFLCEVPGQVKEDIVNYCYKIRKNIYYIPEISDVVAANVEKNMLDDVSVFSFRSKELTLGQRMIKRTMDIVLALMMAIVTAPIWIVSAVAIKLYDHGPILFKQKRATLNGRIFYVYKFRTMRENVENRSVTKDDDRITGPGKILRKIRMDELPQLLNILKGDMSFVGPRPEMLENVTAYTKELPEFEYRLRVKAGLTGFAQIAGKYNTSPKDKLIMDLLYIEQYSVWNDIRMLFQTAIVFFKSDSTEAFDENLQKDLELFEDDENE